MQLMIFFHYNMELKIFALWCKSNNIEIVETCFDDVSPVIRIKATSFQTTCRGLYVYNGNSIKDIHVFTTRKPKNIAGWVAGV